MTLQQTESVKEFGGWLNRYTHSSASCQCDMTFSVYLPPQAKSGPVPAVYYLSGLTCTDDNVRTKAGAQRYAAELGLALIMPDTSPRGDQVPDEPERYDLGKGAGFYVNATATPWATNYQMYDYVVNELPALIEAELPVQAGNCSITGHSMGGHGALVIALRNPGKYKSVSAFAPICHPVNCDWGKGCFGAYLGDEQSAWQAYDTTELIKSGAMLPSALIDQGLGDEFLSDQLLLEDLEESLQQRSDLSVEIRRQPDYDHSYHFISSFIGEHLAFHSKYLVKQ